ncbi:MAG: 4-alpha-glucanotransferase [Lachnospiraceae bacterium]|nr:4-alpha-glucanotransferase [Lachnospiraceae bacterium]
MRASGILCPVSSLSSRYGIGCFSKEAYDFVDFLVEAGQTYWQVLPFGPTGYGDSPYQTFSTFAGNPYFIDPATLIEDGLLLRKEAESFDFGREPERVDYGALYNGRFKLLKLAFERFMEKPDEEYEGFKEKNAFWLYDYGLYMALKGANGGKAWPEWDDELKLRDEKALAAARKEYAETVEFYCFQQYEFAKQWAKLRKYANDKGLMIIGDIPFYTSADSSDTWANPQLFLMDEECLPKKVAGCPPDAFSADGQLWGNPIYDWAYLKETNYEWWIRRIAACLELVDVLRVDHFRAFDEYYEIPYGEKTAVNGRWVKGPGIGLFKEAEKQLGELHIIAEDLGYITDSVRALVRETGFPGMKVLQFAFDSREESDYLPHNYEHDCVVYTGTHDNETTRGWIENINHHDREFARCYIGSVFTDYGQFTWDFIRTAQASVADLCIVPIQDYLVKDNKARINHPSTTGGNWQWRLVPDELSDELAKSIYKMSKLYGRVPKKPEPEEKAEEEVKAAEEETGEVK